MASSDPGVDHPQIPVFLGRNRVWGVSRETCPARARRHRSLPAGDSKTSAKLVRCCDMALRLDPSVKEPLVYHLRSWAGRLANIRKAWSCERRLDALGAKQSRGDVGDRAFLAFKLHRFISGAGRVYTTLRGAG